MQLRELALKVAEMAQDAGKHALLDQLKPHDMVNVAMPKDQVQHTSETDQRLVRFLERQLTSLDPFQGNWRDRPQDLQSGSRYWCVGNIDGSSNYIRNMAEWTVTVSLFEFNEEGSAQPILGVVHAPVLGLTYLAGRQQGAIRIRRTPTSEKRENIMPSTMKTLDGSVVSYGMSYVSNESDRALRVIAELGGKPADIKRIGPASLDLCKVADGTYDAYFEPHLHTWDIPAVSAGTVVVWESQGTVSRWNGKQIHWRSENDVVASNGLVLSELRPYLERYSWPGSSQ